jgi:hypothetical protein
MKSNNEDIESGDEDVLSAGRPVGYGQPPLHTRFKKGQSGNPGGRPRGMTTGRANKLALKEAYRPVTVREGDKILTLPAIQAVLRSQVALAAKGNGPAQRALIEAIQAIEREISAEARVNDKAQSNKPPMSDLEVARRIAFLLSKPLRTSGQPQLSQLKVADWKR